MNQVYIQPRQTGKTTIAIAKFLESPKNSVIITPSDPMMRSLYKRLPPKYHNRIFSVTNPPQTDGNDRYRLLENIIIDDYLCDNSEDIYRLYYKLKRRSEKKITFFTYTTSNFLYNESVFNFIKNEKTKVNPDYSFNNYYITVNFPQVVDLEGYKKDFKENRIRLVNNLITEENTRIIKNGKFPGDIGHTVHMLGKWKSQSEVLGKLFDKEKLDINDPINKQNLYIYLEKLLNDNFETEKYSKIQIDINLLEKSFNRTFDITIPVTKL